MYYTESKGVQANWRDTFEYVAKQLQQRSLLPTVVAALLVAWIALIIIGLQQTVFNSPTVPDRTNVGSGTGTTLSVADTSNVSSTQGSSGTTKNMATWADMAGVVNQASTSSQVAAGLGTIVSESDVIGGRGADTPTAPASDVVEPIIDPIVDVVDNPPVTGGGEEDTDDDIEVIVPGTPVTDPLPVNLNVSLPISTGGLL